MIHIPSSTWHSKIVRKRLRIPRTHSLRREQTVRSEGFSRELQGEPGESQRTESTDDAEARADFIYRHHIEPRVQLHVPKEERFPFPLKYTDVTRSTCTGLDVMQEKRVDDYWIVDSDRSLSDSWKSVTKFTLLKEKTSQRIFVVLGKTDQIMYGQKYGPKLVMPLGMGKKKELGN